MNQPTPTPSPSAAAPAPELLPCPFCGEAPTIDSTENHSEHGGDDSWMVCCGTYGCHGNAYCLDNTLTSRKMAVESWNARHTTPAPAVTPATADEEPRRLADAADRAVSAFIQSPQYGEKGSELYTDMAKLAEAHVALLRATPSVPAPQEMATPTPVLVTALNLALTAMRQGRDYCISRALTHGAFDEAISAAESALSTPAPTDPCASELEEALEIYADPARWTDEIEATEGGEHECKVYTSNKTTFSGHKGDEDGWEVAASALTRYRQRSSPANGAEGKK